MTFYSVYLHIPFCRHRCAYCDFNTYAGIDSLIPDYVNALVREIELLGGSAGERLPVHTVFFGGGTPSLLPVEEVEKILGAVDQAFDLQPNLEVTLEANPGTLSADNLTALRRLGVNRLSLGVQSASPEELRLLERQHSPEDVIQAVRWARGAGFDNLNLDLIFGIPYQSLENWMHTLDWTLSLHPEHFSLYALTLEHGTPMQNWVNHGLLPEPDEDLAAEMYELASDRLEAAGYEQYEISNWALRRGELMSCRHNLQYWRNLPYLGFGAGAHGYAACSRGSAGRDPGIEPAEVRGIRTANVLAPSAYIQRCLNGTAQDFPRTPATVEATPIRREDEIGETMMMGLRLVQDGVSRQAFAGRFGEDLDSHFDGQIRRLTAKGLLEWAGDRLRLTKKGRLLGNQVFVEFI